MRQDTPRSSTEVLQRHDTTARRWLAPAVLLSIGLVGVSAGAVGFSMGGTYGAAVASVIVLASVVAASPIFNAMLGLDSSGR